MPPCADESPAYGLVHSPTLLSLPVFFSFIFLLISYPIPIDVWCEKMRGPSQAPSILVVIDNNLRIRVVFCFVC